MSKAYLISELYKQVQEAFDFENIEEKPIKKVGSTKYKSEDGELVIEFQKVEYSDLNLGEKFIACTRIYNVLFTINSADDQSYKTNYEEFISILKSVKTSVLDFVQETNPDVLIFVSIDKKGNIQTDVQKDRLYKYAIMKNLPPGYGVQYDMQPFSFTSMKGIILYKNTIQPPFKEKIVK